MPKRLDKRKRMGHFKREAIINIVYPGLMLLLALLAALFGPFIFKLFKK